jgi:hypothetical protein
MRLILEVLKLRRAALPSRGMRRGGGLKEVRSMRAERPRHREAGAASPKAVAALGARFCAQS